MRNERLPGWPGVSAVCFLLSSLVLARPCAAGGPPPVIVVQPTNQTVLFQGTATFSVSANSQTTLSYQWRKNGANVNQATSSSYTITNAQASDAATYSVKVINGGGSVISSNATLTVVFPPTIQTQPTNVSATQGQTASFSIVASGTAPLSYQWNFNGSLLSGATNSSLSLTNVQAIQAGGYTAVVTNPSGSVTSPVATLTVAIPPTITAQPQSQTKALGQTILFSVVAAGTAALNSPT